MTPELETHRETQPLSGKWTLVVDDESSIVFLYEAYLKRYGSNVLKAGSAEEAVQIIKERNGQVDLIITDYEMAGKTGIELIGEVKDLSSDNQFSYLKSTRIIMVSGNLNHGGNPNDTAKSFGAHAGFSKPIFDFKRFFNEVVNILNEPLPPVA
jgi:CheY-like chemotaxis protein